MNDDAKSGKQSIARFAAPDSIAISRFDPCIGGSLGAFGKRYIFFVRYVNTLTILSDPHFTSL